MTGKIKTEKFIETFKLILKNPAGMLEFTPPTNIIGTTTEDLAINRMKWMIEKNYRQIIKDVPEFEYDQDTRKYLRSAKTRKSFLKKTKCTFPDIIESSLRAVGKDFFDDRIYQKYEGQVRKLSNKYYKAYNKYINEKEEYDKTKKELADTGFNPFQISREIGAKPKEPTKVEQTMSPFEYLASVLSKYNDKIDDKLLEGLNDKPDFNELRKLSYCIDSDFDDISDEYPKVASKLIDKTITKKSKKK